MTYDELTEKLLYLAEKDVILNLHLGPGQKIDLYPK